MNLHYRNSRLSLKKLEKGPLVKSETPPGLTRKANGSRDARTSPFAIGCHSSSTIVADIQLTLSLEFMVGGSEQQPMTFSPWLELSNGSTPTVLWTLPRVGGLPKML